MLRLQREGRPNRPNGITRVDNFKFEKVNAGQYVPSERAEFPVRIDYSALRNE